MNKYRYVQTNYVVILGPEIWSGTTNHDDAITERVEHHQYCEAWYR